MDTSLDVAFLDYLFAFSGVYQSHFFILFVPSIWRPLDYDMNGKKDIYFLLHSRFFLWLLLVVDVYDGIGTSGGPLDVDRTGSSPFLFYLYLDRSSGQPFLPLPPTCRQRDLPVSSCQYLPLRTSYGLQRMPHVVRYSLFPILSHRHVMALHLDWPRGWVLGSLSKEGTGWQPCLRKTAAGIALSCPSSPRPIFSVAVSSSGIEKNSKASWAA